MQNTEPIACTLTAADLEDRREAWLKVGTFGQASTEISGGLAFKFTPATGVYESLEQLVWLEADCCPWMNFTLEDAPGRITLTVRGEDDDGEIAVREAFAPLAAAVDRGRDRSA
jgi:hypothetical protein